MSEHKIRIQWQRCSDGFAFEDYNRDHAWITETGHQLEVSAAPAYFGNPNLLDPEQALAGSLSSCHMLTFLAVASKKGWVIDRYEDLALARLGRTEQGRMAVIQIELKPRVKFAAGLVLSSEDYLDLHERAHKACFVANALSCAVVLEPTLITE